MAGGKMTQFSGTKTTTKAHDRRLTKNILKKVDAGRESKYHDTVISEPADHDGNALDLSDIVQSTTVANDTTRQGDRVEPFRLEMRGQILLGDTTNAVRLIVFQCKSGTVTKSEVLSALYLGTVNAQNSPYRHDYRSQYTILFDKTYHLEDGGSQQINIVKKIKIRRKMQWSAGSSTEHTAGEIRLLVLSDSSVSTHPLLTMVTRLFFKDV